MSEEANHPRGESDHENEVKQPGVKEKGGESAGYRFTIYRYRSSLAFANRDFARNNMNVRFVASSSTDVPLSGSSRQTARI